MDLNPPPKKRTETQLFIHRKNPSTKVSSGFLNPVLSLTLSLLGVSWRSINGSTLFFPFLQGLRGRGVSLKIYPKRGLSNGNPHVFAVFKRDI